jgi:putative ABC transport system permease protein
VIVSALDRKLLRDLWQIKTQALAIAAVIACGIATYVMTLATVSSLDLTQHTYYDRYNFADVFLSLKRAPSSLAPRIAEIPGVARVETRISRDVSLDVQGLAEPAVGRLISLPEHDDGAALNRVYLRLGRMVDPERDDEVLASEAFALKNHFAPGDRLSAVINGHKRELKVVGIALSPEYIFTMRGGELFPDDRRFGVLWMARRPLEYAFDMRGAFNDVCLKLTPGASEQEVIRRLDALTAEYGGLGAVGRGDQVSNKFVSDEITQLRGMAHVAPSIFMAVAAFLLNVVLSRIISTQREQIAALKAFGYGRAAVGWHYAKLTLAIVLIGTAAGMIGGVALSNWLTVLYTKFYRFPLLTYHFDPSVFFWAGLLAVGSALAGTLFTVRAAMRLPPAEAMRPPAPATYRPTVLERLGLSRLLSQTSRMILRHLERNWFKSMLSVVGVAAAVAILVMGFFTAEAFDYVLDVQFQFAQREDLTVSFVEPRPPGVAHELEHLPGVTRCEPFRVVPCRLVHGQRSRRMSLLGLDRHPDLNRLIDDRIKPVELPPEGIVLGTKLAEVLDVREGDLLTVEVLEGNRPVLAVPVTGLVEEFVGAGAYADRAALNRMMHEGESVSGAFLSADDRSVNDLYNTLKRRPAVASVSVREANIRAFNEVQAENVRIIRTFYVVFGVIIAGGVVYNTAQIALQERSRELASLRVLGFTRMEISAILLGELGLLTLLSLPVGMVMGYGLAWMITQSVDTEQVRIPLLIKSSTYASACLVVVVAAVVSGLIVRRKLDRLDLVAVLKMQD